MKNIVVKVFNRKNKTFNGAKYIDTKIPKAKINL